MYFDIVKAVLDKGIGRHATTSGLTSAAVCDLIKAHIEKTSEEHYKDEPQIDYPDPLCRLGYVYVHAAANATLFQRTLAQADELKKRIKLRDGKTLSICAVGGGPGTEMLGLVKFLATRPYLPSRIDFLVLDGVPHWSESWKMLAKEAEAELAKRAAVLGVPAPAVAPMFLPMDVMSAASYSNYGYSFAEVDLVVFNYLLSENKKRLTEFHDALKFIVTHSDAGTMFAFIDRKEYATSTFVSNVRWLTQNSGITVLQELEFGSVLDRDEQTSDLESYLDKFKRLPRTKFWESWQKRPTAFAIVCTKP